ncbi:amidohydrolase family protein [Sedimentitalea todarodis]|uniref:Amidohydrolase family protein n=1 Tax=Sedimentitalea todarodis TaxID=1631240 RepID=A0ABU3VM26_9RHOB|nr:amidohydrolase family protein [Sedimentitalea todarodis]MDU9007249.1 amidohydrolase family protein [Sedimentitalea todarodis]
MRIYSHRLEHQQGSIEPGKLANFTILADNPVTIDAAKLKNIEVWGTVMEGRKLPVGYEKTQKASLYPMPDGADKVEFSRAAVEHTVSAIHAHV